MANSVHLNAVNQTQIVTGDSPSTGECCKWSGRKHVAVFVVAAAVVVVLFVVIVCLLLLLFCLLLFVCVCVCV